jgi:glutamine amidotransferase
MCELFAISSAVTLQPEDLLRLFFSHSKDNQNGWGLAVFHQNGVNLEKEPIRADQSIYLNHRLPSLKNVSNLFAHIRKATKGNISYENCHPFVMNDCEGRTWTLMHNGTIFNCPALEPYVRVQEGMTDSERILCYIIDRINAAGVIADRKLTLEERFKLVDDVVCEVSLHNKLNLIIYDGEIFYIHTNYKNSLYVHQETHTAIFATVPIDRSVWLPLPFTTLLAYKDGRHIMTGTCHGHEYIDNAADMQYMYLDYLEY